MEKPIQAYISESLYRRLNQRIVVKKTTIKAVIVAAITKFLEAR
jgi:hypothetical protein